MRVASSRCRHNQVWGYTGPVQFGAAGRVDLDARQQQAAFIDREEPGFVQERNDVVLAVRGKQHGDAPHALSLDAQFASGRMGPDRCRVEQVALASTSIDDRKHLQKTLDGRTVYAWTRSTHKSGLQPVPTSCNANGGRCVRAGTLESQAYERSGRIQRYSREVFHSKLATPDQLHVVEGCPCGKLGNAGGGVAMSVRVSCPSARHVGSAG